MREGLVPRKPEISRLTNHRWPTAVGPLSADFIQGTLLFFQNLSTRVATQFYLTNNIKAFYSNFRCQISKEKQIFPDQLTPCVSRPRSSLESRRECPV